MASRTIDKPKPRIGVDMYTIFEVKSDTAEAITYGDAVTIPGPLRLHRQTTARPMYSMRTTAHMTLRTISKSSVTKSQTRIFRPKWTQ